MEGSESKDNRKKELIKVKTYIVPFGLEESQTNHSIADPFSSILSKEQIINQAFKLHSQGKISEAVKHYKNLINQGFADHKVFSNYGVALRDLGNLSEAEIYIRKAIKLKPDFGEAYSNLGLILRDLGNLSEAEICTRKSIDIEPRYAIAHYNLGNILKELGNLKEAELSQRKAIKLKPDFWEAYCTDDMDDEEYDTYTDQATCEANGSGEEAADGVWEEAGSDCTEIIWTLVSGS